MRKGWSKSYPLGVGKTCDEITFEREEQGSMGKSMTTNHKVNIALACSSGGHFEQMTNLSDLYSRYDHFWITNRSKQTESQLKSERRYYIASAHFKEPWIYLSQLGPVLKAFVREKPTHLLSTGSGRTVLIPFLLSRLLKVKVIHVDTFSRVHGHSKFGTFLLKAKNKIYTQWEDPQNDNAIYIGPILKQEDGCGQDQDSKHVFVTVGTREEPFTRLIKEVEGLVKKGKIEEKVIIQAGHTKYRSDVVEIFDFCPPEGIKELILNARYVVTQESAGIGTLCLRYKKRFIVMPRDYKYGELFTKSDMNEDLHYKLEEMGYTRVVTNTEELENAVENVETLKIGFNFNNRLAISTLEKALEEP
jgi:UDP-N-acetylglucosamine transferase subunit ALG13